MATWPASLPGPLNDSYAEGEPKLVLGTQTDIGPLKTRKRYTAGIRPHNFEFLWTKAELSTFLTFYRGTINAGADSFDFTHPRELTTVVMLLDPEVPPSWVADQTKLKVSLTFLELP